jgi:hypothetical protein
MTNKYCFYIMFFDMITPCSKHLNQTPRVLRNERHNKRHTTVCNHHRINGIATIGGFFSTHSNAIKRGYKMKAYDFICEDKNRTDPPELEYFTRFIDRLCDPEDPKEYRESLEDYPPMTDAEIAQARIEALEHKRLLDIELKRVYRVARILGKK